MINQAKRLTIPHIIQEKTMKKRTLAIILLLTIIAPFVLFANLERIKDYIPPTEPYKKTPYQFEKAFNEQMAQYGMSIDIDSVNYTYKNDGDTYKTVPIQCDDGSVISCVFDTTSDKRKSLIWRLAFEQQTMGAKDETVYITPLLEFILQEFETPMANDKDAAFGLRGLSYNQAIQTCEQFLANDDDKCEFHILAGSNFSGAYVLLSRFKDSQQSMSILIKLW
jgi:hypothetical protein